MYRSARAPIPLIERDPIIRRTVKDKVRTPTLLHSIPCLMQALASKLWWLRHNSAVTATSSYLPNNFAG